MTNYNAGNIGIPTDLSYTELAVVRADIDMLNRNDIYQVIVPFSNARTSHMSVFDQYGEPIYKGEHATLWLIPNTQLMVKVTPPTSGEGTQRQASAQHFIDQMLFMHWLNDGLDDARRRNPDVTVELPDIHFAFTAPNGGSLQVQSYKEGYVPLDTFARDSQPLAIEALRLRQEACYHISYALGRLAVNSQLTALSGLEGLRLQQKKNEPFDARHVLVPADTPHAAAAEDMHYCLIDQPQRARGRAAALFARRHYRNAGSYSPIFIDTKK